MKSWLLRAVAILAAALAALAMLAMWGDARSEVIELTLTVDCLPGELAAANLARDGVALVKAYVDRFGQQHERWERADGAWLDIAVTADGWRCILAGGLPAGEPS